MRFVNMTERTYCEVCQWEGTADTQKALMKIHFKHVDELGHQQNVLKFLMYDIGALTVKDIPQKLDEYISTTPYDMLSFFEICEAIGFLYFVNKKVDWAILEVGLGGRYDASNIIPHKDIAVITNIGLDHTNILGNNKKLIAYEKAGIIKTGCRVFTGVTQKPILDVIKKECDKTGASLKILNFKFEIFKQFLNDSILKKFGKHQINNAKLCINIAKHLNIPEVAIKKGLQKTKLPLRMEIVSKNPMIILDGAHNPDKIKTTIEAVTDHRSPITNLHLIIAFTADKNISKMIKQLATL